MDPRRRLLLSLLATPAVGALAQARVDAGRGWAASWAAAPQDLGRVPLPGGVLAPPDQPLPAFGDLSLRQRFFATLGGDRVRVRLSNRFGRTPLRILGASLAVQTGDDAASPSSLRRLRFGGRDELLLAPGAEAFSDPLDFAVDAGQALLVGFKPDPDSRQGTIHRLPHESGFQVAGDGLLRARWADAQPAVWNHVVVGMDVATRAPTRVLVAFGDSLTAGAGVEESASRLPVRYPDRLAAALRGRPDGAPAIGVVNAGISGNRLLADGIGPRGLDRFERDVLGQSGVTQVLVLIGINDIGFDLGRGRAGTAAADDPLIAGLRQLRESARARGIKFMLGTLMPFKGAAYWSEEKEARRVALNRWIRGQQDVDAVVDFDAALRDPVDPQRLAPANDSGDHLHPGNVGYAAMAGAIDLRELRE